MMHELICENIDIQYRYLTEKFSDEIAMAIEELVSDSHVYTEAEKKQQEENKLLKFIKSIMKTISDMISGVIEKIGGLFSKAKVNEENANIKIKGIDTEAAIKFVNQDFKDSKQILQDYKDGKIGVDEIKAFISKQELKMSSIGTVVASAAAVFGAAKLNEKFLRNWKKEADDAYKRTQEDGSNQYAAKYANAYYDDTKKQVKEDGAKLIATHMKDATQFALANIVLNPLKKLYQVNYLSNKIGSEGEALNDKKGFSAIKRGKKAEIKENERERKNEENKKKVRDKNAGILSTLTRKQNESRDELNRTRNRVYNDTNFTVPDDN